MSIDQDRFISFKLGGEAFAIPLLSVREVIAVPQFTPVPQSSSHFLGMMNLRGQVISAIDLRVRLGLKPTAGSEQAIIIVELAGVVLGLLVDSIDNVLNVKPEELSQKPEMTDSPAARYISAIYRSKETLVLLIDLGKVLDVAEVQALPQRKAV